MFESLKKKLTSFLGISNKPAEKEERPKKEKVKTSKKTKSKPAKERVKQEIEQTPEPPKETIKEAEQGFFSKLLKKVSSSTLTEEEFNTLFSEFEIELLENNVALEAVDSLKEYLKKDLVGIDIKKGKEAEAIKDALKSAITNLVQEPPSLLQLIKHKLERPYIILALGINGTGKTTTLAKLASYLKQNKLSVALAAADTFRAASIEQIEKHANSLQIPLIKKEYGSDPASVAFEAIQFAKKNKIDVLLIDTAGRMHTNSNLMRELEKVVRVSNPDLKLFIGEAITGNDSIEQAKTFNSSISIDGSILTKAEIDDKAGAVLSISHITKKPIFFLGTGQSYKDLTPFTRSWFLKQLDLE